VTFDGRVVRGGGHRCPSVVTGAEAPESSVRRREMIYQARGDDEVLLQSNHQDLTIDAKMRATGSGRMLVPAALWERVARRSGLAQFR
jgi:hypothetical protein